MRNDLKRAFDRKMLANPGRARIRLSLLNALRGCCLGIISGLYHRCEKSTENILIRFPVLGQCLALDVRVHSNEPFSIPG